MKLPLLISLPHAGLDIPEEVASLCSLSTEEIAADGDDGAREIYDLAGEVSEFVTTDVARAIVDVNRSESDRRADGVVKTHTCWNVRVYSEPPAENIVESLLARYYRPYHSELRRRAGGVVLGIDCHTMSAFGPPIGPGAGVERPSICLSNGEGTCPDDWFLSLAESLERTFGKPVALNEPFRGGHIIRSHAGELPWVQLELSRAPFAPYSRKREAIFSALRQWWGARSR